ncbi:bifunctional phosphoglucose/phosphomannose isomerase [Candidatus Saccharibacteria bacterium]|nr:bifunctional phosphoglucose/phosphomannose isomerase [Candidatus Saccharibacteria bacterium]
MLDDVQVYTQKDPSGALGVAASEWEQARYEAEIKHQEHDGRTISRVVFAGMGGSSLSALLVKSWLEDSLSISFEVVRTYHIPAYVDSTTLVIISSSSGNTEETLSCLDDAIATGAQLAVLTSGGVLLERADAKGIAHVVLPDRSQYEPRMTTIAQIRAVAQLLAHFGVVDSSYYERVSQYSDWLRDESASWTAEVTTDKNIAKQLALFCVGKTPVFYAGHLMAPVAYKWKISWNENAKNLAFWNEYPEFNHNEFIGWSSHPIEKPFAVIDLVSEFEHERIQKRFAVSDKLLSGRRPKAHIVRLQGETPLAQMLWGCILADFVSIYVAVLNGVDPTPVDLIEKFKKELAN